MAFASDLMGLGMPPGLATQISSIGTGPLVISAVSSTFATTTRILANQSMVYVTGQAASTCGVGLPVVGGDAGALLGDVFVIANVNATDCLKVFGSTGVAICVGGSNTSSAATGLNGCLILYPVTSTQWIGVRGVA